MPFYFPVVVTPIRRVSLAESTLKGGMPGEDTKTDMETTVDNNMRTIVVGKEFSHRQAIIIFIYLH